MNFFGYKFFYCVVFLTLGCQGALLSEETAPEVLNNPYKEEKEIPHASNWKTWVLGFTGVSAVVALIGYYKFKKQPEKPPLQVQEVVAPKLTQGEILENLKLHISQKILPYIQKLEQDKKNICLYLGVSIEQMRKARFDKTCLFLDLNHQNPDHKQAVKLDFNDFKQLNIFKINMQGKIDKIEMDRSVFKFTKWRTAHLMHIKEMLKIGGIFILPQDIGEFALASSIVNTVVGYLITTPSLSEGINEKQAIETAIKTAIEHNKAIAEKVFGENNVGVVEKGGEFSIEMTRAE